MIARVSTSDRYGLAIVTIAANYVISVTVTGEAAAAWSVMFGLGTILLVFAVSGARWAGRVAAGAIPVALAAALYVSFYGGSHEGTALETLLTVVNLGLYLIAPVVILRHIVRRRQVDAQTMYGAIAAYLLIGMMFAFALKLISQVQLEPPLFGDQGHGTMAQVLFFSFVTLTTTGYGNLVPAGNPAQTLAVLEAILGQLFLVTAVGKIVTAWTPVRGGGALQSGLGSPADDPPGS